MPGQNVYFTPDMILDALSCESDADTPTEILHRLLRQIMDQVSIETLDQILADEQAR